MRVLVTVKNILKGVKTEKRGKKDFKRGGGKLSQGVGSLRAEDWNPLMKYVLEDTLQTVLNAIKDLF